MTKIPKDDMKEIIQLSNEILKDTETYAMALDMTMKINMVSDPAALLAVYVYGATLLSRISTSKEHFEQGLDIAKAILDRLARQAYENVKSADETKH
jgi:hypothetical protein